mmetsp:Transcript_13542/g.44218  ORF Transcript_13542/g.44218 Transcript_13542/m.44218 type:complete len:200 (-) Transcript_13542:162-761(-)
MTGPKQKRNRSQPRQSRARNWRQAAESVTSVHVRRKTAPSTGPDAIVVRAQASMVSWEAQPRRKTVQSRSSETSTCPPLSSSPRTTIVSPLLPWISTLRTLVAASAAPGPPPPPSGRPAQSARPEIARDSVGSSEQVAGRKDPVDSGPAVPGSAGDIPSCLGWCRAPGPPARRARREAVCGGASPTAACAHRRGMERPV